MSHNIKYFEFKEDVNRKRVQADLDKYVAQEDWEEGCSGLDSPIRWIENCGVLNSYDEALEYIKSHDKGWYDSLAVRYKEYDGTKTTALKKAEEKFEVAKRKWIDLTNKFHFENSKAAFIGCQHCGSKISRKHLNGNNCCPVCDGDLRPKSTLDTLARYEANLAKAKALVLEEKEKAKAKNSKTMWLVKIEYHT
jgi:Zn finger protein HypA/HybF involved in hydrogenase expression